MDKLFLIIISAIHMSIADVQTKLNLNYLRPIDTISLAQAQLQANHISMAQYGDKILIVSNSLVPDFFDKQPSAFEIRMRHSFPDADITVLTLNSKITLYGYATISHGKRLRTKSGAENIVYLDKGAPLPQETAVSRETLFTKEQLASFKISYTKEEENGVISNAVAQKIIPQLLQQQFNTADINKTFNDIKVTEYQ